MNYDLELDKAIKAIQGAKAKTVVLQLPDGLKAHAKIIQDKLEAATQATILLWAGTNFGSCDTPNLHSIKADLLLAWGHSAWMPIANA